MIHLSKTYLMLAFTAALLQGCSGLSKDEICEACEGKEEKPCRTTYDVCKLAAFSSVKMMKNRWK